MPRQPIESMTIKQNIAKDKLLETFAKNKLFLLALVVLVLLAKQYSRTVLNLPSTLIWSKYVLAIGFTIIFFIKRINKFNTFYRKKIKNLADIVILFFRFIFLSVILWLTIHVILSYLIFTLADKEPITYNCKITTDFTINEDKVMYSFKNKNYIIGIIHTQTLADLRNKYYIKIEVTKSIFNSYILSYGQLREKTEDTIITGD
jgi:hypothetical protein